MPEKKWQIGQPIFEADLICPDHRVWPWNGHRLFAYDLVRFLKPQLYVELGTYWGTSFFTVCQAVKDAQLMTRCVAVDCWEGDSQTGPYGGNVYETVCKIRQDLFASINTELIRSYFKDAVDKIADASIDLLHIDGLHTYEAVKEDYETWYPKLADNGIILFHDIADSCEYGSVKFWHELAESLPSFSFQHSWGLGVLFPKGQLYLDLMEKNNLTDKLKIYEYKAELDLCRITNSDLEGFNKQQDSLIKQQEQNLEALNNRIVELEKELGQVVNSKSYKLLKRISALNPVK